MKLTLLAACLALSFTALGCARVKPHQREIHASRAMAVDDDKADAKLDSHVQEYREGSVGGAGVGGGGCGCN